jgi:hypothetical protein
MCTCCGRYVADVHGPSAAAAAHSTVRELLYGCQDGRLVQLLVDASTVRQGFVIPGQSSSGDVRAAVTAIHCGADYSKVTHPHMQLHAAVAWAHRQLPGPPPLR